MSSRDLAASLDRPSSAGRDASASYLSELARRPPLPRELERRLVSAAKRGDAEARVRLVEAFLPLVASLARRYASGAHVERLELMQEGVAGLLQALERYDVERDTPFWAYARHWVRRSMQRLVAELGDAVSLSDTALRTLARMRRAEDELMGELHREPAPDEIIARSGVDPDAGRRLLDVTRPPRSLQEPITTEDGGLVGTLEGFVGDTAADDAYEQLLDRIEAEELMSLLSELSDRERQVLRWRFGLDGPELGPREIGERLGLGERRVREIERRARNKLRAAARGAGDGDGGGWAA